MSDALRLARSYFDAWNRHDDRAIVAAFAEGGTYTDPLAPGLTGEAIGAYARALWGTFPDLSFEIEGETLEADRTVAARWVMRGTNAGPFRGLPPTGRRIELHGADFLRVARDGIRSVHGYFDAGEVPRQLGLQTLVQPRELGPFRFGNAVAVQSGRPAKPGAFGITALRVRSEEEGETMRELGRQIAIEMLEMPGFIGWTGMAIGDRFLTVTAWDDPSRIRPMMRSGTHARAMERFYASELGVAGFTSVWVPERINDTWIRCDACGRMASYEATGGRCACGSALASPPAYW